MTRKIFCTCSVKIQCFSLKLVFHLCLMGASDTEPLDTEVQLYFPRSVRLAKVVCWSRSTGTRLQIDRVPMGCNEWNKNLNTIYLYFFLSLEGKKGAPRSNKVLEPHLKTLIIPVLHIPTGLRANRCVGYLDWWDGSRIGASAQIQPLTFWVLLSAQRPNVPW